jgi:hypothetical protein
MRAILALLCVFCSLPNDARVESFDGGQEPKVEWYRALLSDLASGTNSAIRTPIDLPEGLKEAIEAWTRT